MIKRKTTKKVGKVKAVKKEKLLKVQIEQPEVEIAPETYKKKPIEPVEPTLLPAEPSPEPVVNPNEPQMVGIDTGFKKPSITNVKPAYTKKQYEALIAAYKKQNPAKYKLKKSELDKKLKEKK